MRHSRFGNGESQDAFTDLLFNVLLGFALMFVTALALIRDESEGGNIESKAEVLITVRWPDGHPDDVDTLVEDPRGNLLWYRNRDTGLMHLDRDDRGTLADQSEGEAGRIETPINQESATLRALAKGEYTVNVFHFKAHTDEPVPVSVKVEKLNPRLELVHYDTLSLGGIGDEKTAVRFTIDARGNVSGTRHLDKPLLSTAIQMDPPS